MKRFGILFASLFILSLVIGAVGCSNEEAPTPTPAPMVTATPPPTATPTPTLTPTPTSMFSAWFAFDDNAFGDTGDVPSGVAAYVDNRSRRLRTVGIANPHTSRYVCFSSNPIPLAGVTTVVFEADIAMPTGLRSGLPAIDPLGDRSEPDSMGTPVLFRIELVPDSTFVEISMQSLFGLMLEQVINNLQPPDAVSANGGIAQVGVPIAKWTGGPASFDPLGLVPEQSVDARFHARLSIDFAQNKVRADITPAADGSGDLNPLPAGSYGAIASPFSAVTNLVDFTKDRSFDGNLYPKIYVHTNGNTDVDDPSAPGGTLRYIDREFTNVQFYCNEPLEFPPVPVQQYVFYPDDFNDGVVAPYWEILPSQGLSFQENGTLVLQGTQTDSGTSASALLANPSGRQDVTVAIDFRAPTGVSANTYCMFRVQLDPFNYFEIGISEGGYNLTRVIDNQPDASGGCMPLFGNERDVFHRLTLSYVDETGHVEAFLDGIQLDGIQDKQFSSSFADIRFAFFSFSVGGQYIEREWDNFESSENLS